MRGLLCVLLGLTWACNMPSQGQAGDLVQHDRWTEFPDWVSSVAFDPAGTTLAAGSYDVVRVRDVAAKKDIATLKVGAGFNRALAFSSTDHLLAIGTYQKVELWDTATWQRVRTLKGIKGYVTGIAFVGDRLVTAGEDGCVRIWTIADGLLQQTFTPVEQPIQGLAVAPNGETVALACGDETRLSQKGAVIVLSLATGEEKHRFVDHERPVTCVTFSDDGQWLLSGSVDEHVNVIDITVGKGTGFFGKHSRPVTGVQTIPGTSIAVSGSGGRFKGKNEVRVWEVADGTELAAVEAHDLPVSAVAVSTSGMIALGSRDRSVSIWSTADIRPTETAPAATSIQQAAAPTPLAQVYFQNEAPIRIGVIGLDTSHSLAFTKTFNADPPRPELTGMRVVAAYPQGSRDIPSSVSRIPEYTEKMREMDVEIVDSIAALLSKVDCVLLETNDGRPHLEQVTEVLKAGKPVFVDKPLAASLRDCVQIFALADEYGVPLFSSSSLRFMEGALAARGGTWGNITGCDAFSPCSLEPTHPELFWYGIHGVEILFTVMGPDVETVTRVSTESTDFAVGKWKDGRIGTFRGIRSGQGGYGGYVFSDKGRYTLEGFKGYDPLVLEIAKFFRTGEPPVTREETLAIYAFMEAADESKRLGGVPVSIADVLRTARAPVNP